MSATLTAVALNRIKSISFIYDTAESTGKFIKMLNLFGI